MEEALPHGDVGAANLERRDVGQQGDKVLGREVGSPPELGVLMQAEHVLVELSGGTKLNEKNVVWWQLWLFRLSFIIIIIFRHSHHRMVPHFPGP